MANCTHCNFRKRGKMANSYSKRAMETTKFETLYLEFCRSNLLGARFVIETSAAKDFWECVHAFKSFGPLRTNRSCAGSILQNRNILSNQRVYDTYITIWKWKKAKKYTKACCYRIHIYKLKQKFNPITFSTQNKKILSRYHRNNTKWEYFLPLAEGEYSVLTFWNCRVFSGLRSVSTTC